MTKMAIVARRTRSMRSLRAAKVLPLCFCIYAAGCDKRDSTSAATSARPQLAVPSGQNAPNAASAPSAPSRITTPSASGSPPSKPQARCVTPESAGVVPLSELKGEGVNEVAAVTAARRELKHVLEIPDEYYGNVQSAGDLVLLELWPRTAFLPENCQDSEKHCAKCRTFSYDSKRGRIVSTKVWEQAEDDSSGP